MTEDLLGGLRQFWNLSCDYKHSPYDRDQSDYQERLGQQAVHTKRNLNGIKQLNDQKHQQDRIEEFDNAGRQRVAQDRAQDSFKRTGEEGQGKNRQ